MWGQRSFEGQNRGLLSNPCFQAFPILSLKSLVIKQNDLETVQYFLRFNILGLGISTRYIRCSTKFSIKKTEQNKRGNNLLGNLKNKNKGAKWIRGSLSGVRTSCLWQVYWDYIFSDSWEIQGKVIIWIQAKRTKCKSRVLGGFKTRHRY